MYFVNTKHWSCFLHWEGLYETAVHCLKGDLGVKMKHPAFVVVKLVQSHMVQIGEDFRNRSWNMLVINDVNLVVVLPCEMLIDVLSF